MRKLKKGDIVKLNKDVVDLGISPNYEEFAILCGDMTIEAVQDVEIDNQPDFQSFFIEGLPYLFYTGSVKLVNRETLITRMIKELKVGDKFKFDFTKLNPKNKQSFIIIENNYNETKTVCYDSQFANDGFFGVNPGNIYTFEDNDEVQWITNPGKGVDNCRGCGQKLVVDSFGEYCPNEWCDTIR